MKIFVFAMFFLSINTFAREKILVFEVFSVKNWAPTIVPNIMPGSVVIEENIPKSYFFFDDNYISGMKKIKVKETGLRIFTVKSAKLKGIILKRYKIFPEKCSRIVITSIRDLSEGKLEDQYMGQSSEESKNAILYRELSNYGLPVPEKYQELLDNGRTVIKRRMECDKKVFKNGINWKDTDKVYTK